MVVLLYCAVDAQLRFAPPGLCRLPGMLLRCARLLRVSPRVHVNRGRSERFNVCSHRCVGSRAAAVAHEGPKSVESPTASFRAAIDFKAIVENLDAVRENASNRQSSADADKVADLYAQFVQLGRETDTVRQERNENAKAMKVRTSARATHAVRLLHKRDAGTSLAMHFYVAGANRIVHQRCRCARM